MATYYVYSGAAGANNGTSWTDAYLTFAQAVTAATTNGDIILIHKTHTDILGASTTYTFGAHILVKVVDKDASDALSIMDGTTGYVGHTTSSFSITINGGFKVRVYGLALRTAGASLCTITVGSSDNSHMELESCYLWAGSTAASSFIGMGNTGSVSNNFTKLKNCTLRFGNTGNTFSVASRLIMRGGSVSSAGSAPSNFITNTAGNPGLLEFEGVNLAHITGNLVADQTSAELTVKFRHCLLGTGVTVLATQSNGNLSSGEVFIFDCAIGDTHYNMAHYNAFGNTTVSASIYANDGASYDGTNKCSWVVTTTANCSYYTPYESPWFDKYNAGGVAVTPSIEILRDGSTTAYQDNEVWGEWGYKGTNGSTQMTFVNDAVALDGTPANQAAGAGLSNWTGESGTAWSGKLAPASSFTPQEIGDIRARICVGVASSTVYADPTMRI